MPKEIIPPVETLIEQLHGDDWPARCDAARLLGQSRDPRALEALLPDLQDQDWRVRRNAAQALGALRDPRAVEPLLLALNDRTQTVRQRAIVALGRIKDPRALPALLEVVKANRHESYDAAKAVRKFGKKALPEIASAFHESGNEQLMLMLVEMKYKGMLEILLELLDNPDPARRLTALRELGRLGDQRAIPPVQDQLRNDDPLVQSETVRALAGLGAVEAVPALLALLRDDELYGPRSGVYHAVTEAFQSFSGIRAEIRDAFPGDYPAMLNMGGAPVNLPELTGLIDNLQSPVLQEAFRRFQNGFEISPQPGQEVNNMARKVMEDLSWKFGVMFADARDASRERVKRLTELLASAAVLERAAAALSLPWYAQEQSLEALLPLRHDPDETVRTAAAWAGDALQKALSYRNQFGM